MCRKVVRVIPSKEGLTIEGTCERTGTIHAFAIGDLFDIR